MKTPRTDAALDKDWTSLDESLENVANLSRQLERELEEIKDVLKLQQKSLFTRKTNNIALDRRNKRLAAALNAIAHCDDLAIRGEDDGPELARRLRFAVNTAEAALSGRNAESIHPESKPNDHE
jgi:hypothetical protein